MNKRKIKTHLDALAKKDGDLAAVLDACGYPAPRVQPEGFVTLLTTIISQQISNQAAATISQRVQALMPEVSAASFIQLDSKALRAAGLSQRKVDYARSLALAIVNRDFAPDKIAQMTDEEAIATIVQLPGFGRWSAEIYLMFSLGREDIFPANDLIILRALKKLKRKRKDLSPAKARQMVVPWAPYKSAASLLLWSMHHHGLLK